MLSKETKQNETNKQTNKKQKQTTVTTKLACAVSVLLFVGSPGCARNTGDSRHERTSGRLNKRLVPSAPSNEVINLRISSS